jgi:flagellar biosynthesis protein FliR
MLLGFALMWVSLPTLFGVFNEFLDQSFQFMMQLLRVTR